MLVWIFFLLGTGLFSLRVQYVCHGYVRTYSYSYQPGVLALKFKQNHQLEMELLAQTGIRRVWAKLPWDAVEESNRL